MRLLACHVENFGKLSDFYMDFTEGMNVINEPNAWGKSTLAAFLKAMFYGLDAKKDAKAFEKERILYRPWQGGSFGGELDFEAGGKTYRISRSFGKTEKTDEFYLYDLSTNLESSDYTKNIGEELFDLDSSSFKRSIYIAQNDCLAESSDGINAKVGNLEEHANDMNSFESASRRLKDVLNKLTPDRVTGSLKRRKNYITQLTQEVHALETARGGYEGIRRKQQQVEAQIRECADIRQNYMDALVVASEDSRKKELYKQYDILCQDVSDKEEKVNAFHTEFPNGIPKMQEIEDQKQTGRIIEELSTSLRYYGFTPEEHESWKKLEDMFREGAPSVKTIDVAIHTLADADRLKEELNNLESLYKEDVEKLKELEDVRQGSGKVSAGSVLLLVLLLLFTALAVAATGYFNPFGLPQAKLIQLLSGITIGGGILMVICGMVMYLIDRKKKKSLQNEQDEHIAVLREEAIGLSENISQIKDNTKDVMITVSRFLEKYRIYCDTASYQAKLYEMKNQLAEYERLQEKNKGFFEFKEKRDAMRSHVQEFAKEYGLSFGEDLINDMNRLENTAIEYRMAQETLQEAQNKKKQFEEEREAGFWTKIARCPYSVEELHKMIEQADRKMEELKDAEAQYQKQLEGLQEQLDLCDEKEAELEEQKELQTAEMEKYKLVKLTHEYLQKAKEQLISRYMGPVSAAFGKYYYMLTGDRRQEWMIDANMNLQMREYGELRNPGYLSAGYQDLVGICMRLALVDAMYQEEKPFLILDDPFLNFDKEKVESGNQFIRSVAEEYQVIYFTCHESRSPV